MNTAGHPPSGAWYYVAIIGSLGLLTPWPYWHATGRLSRVLPQDAARVRRLAIGFSVAEVGLLAASGTNGSAIGALIFAFTVAAAVLIRPYRALVYGTPGRLTARPADRRPDPSLTARSAAADAARRRAEARRIVQQNPGLARELRIGRPDRHPEYLDGGLVDLNSAPAEAIAMCTGLTADAAARILAARERLGGFGSLEEVCAYADLTDGERRALGEHGVLLPR